MRSVLPAILVLGLAAAFSTASAQTAPATAPTAPAATTTPAPVATPAPTTDEGDVVSCRYEKSTGSLFSKRICHTQREWHQMTVDSRALMDNINDHDRMSNGLTGGN